MPRSTAKETKSRRNTGSLVVLARIVTALALLGLLAAVVVALPAAWIFISNQDRIFDNPSQVPPVPIAIVFGAGLQPDGSPSLMLADRVDASATLYKDGRVKRILMTGDNSEVTYNEVRAMKQRAIAKGVPADMVNLDYAGFRTYDSAYRAKAIFGVNKAVLVTQRYHLPRALYLARSFGIDAVGLTAGSDRYPKQTYYDLREFAALAVSWYEVNVTHPMPHYLGEPVDLEQQNR